MIEIIQFQRVDLSLISLTCPWHGSFVGKKRKKAWRAAPLCLMWTIWRERNRRAFDDMERNDQDIKSIFLYTFVNWARVYIEEHTLSLIDFVDWLATK